MFVLLFLTGAAYVGGAFYFKNADGSFNWKWPVTVWKS